MTHVLAMLGLDCVLKSAYVDYCFNGLGPVPSLVVQLDSGEYVLLVLVYRLDLLERDRPKIQVFYERMLYFVRQVIVVCIRDRGLRVLIYRFVHLSLSDHGLALKRLHKLYQLIKLLERRNNEELIDFQAIQSVLDDKENLKKFGHLWR